MNSTTLLIHSSFKKPYSMACLIKVFKPYKIDASHPRLIDTNARPTTRWCFGHTARQPIERAPVPLQPLPFPCLSPSRPSRLLVCLCHTHACASLREPVRTSFARAVRSPVHLSVLAHTCAVYATEARSACVKCRASHTAVPSGNSYPRTRTHAHDSIRQDE